MKKLLFVFVAVIIFTGCQSKTVTGETVIVGGGSYKSISVTELNSMLKDKDFLLVNVHIPFAGNIPGTDLSIPFDQIEQNWLQLPEDKSAKIVLYCRSGRMSQIAAEKFVLLGYTNIWDVTGGMVDWEQAEFQIEK
ncbi:MAG TPA: rhodanese-like domain-containing protein [Anaerolineales bacterium]|nr:rhodanese-like domain-containing protein [Anaerolineales bacterium]